jgi:hypothetical protein
METYADPNVAWGNVPPPREFFGNDKDGWVETPNCDRNTQDMLTHSYSQMLRRELTKIKYDLPNNNAVKNVNNGFVVPSDDWEGLFANNDSVYLTATSYYEAPADGPYLLSEITGRMPLTPTGGLKRGPRFVDVAGDYDVRYFGFSTVDLAGGKPTMDGVADTEIENFYTKNGQVAWEDRRFSIVTGPTKELAQQCGLYKPEEKLFLSTTTPDYYKDEKSEGDPILPLPTFLAYVERFMLASPDRKEAYTGVNGKSPGYVSKKCVELDEPAKKKEDFHPTCYDSDWVTDQLKDNVCIFVYACVCVCVCVYD